MTTTREHTTPWAVTTIRLVCIVAAIIMVSLASVALGSRDVTLVDIAQALGITAGTHSDGSTGWLGSYASADPVAVAAVQLRVPRTILGLLIGACLGVGGALMQGATRNPLADPTILGINSGAACAIVCAIAWVGLSTPIQFIGFALAGGILTAGAVYGIASLGQGGITPLKLTIAGAVLSSILASLSQAILLPRIDVIDAFRQWQVGSISGARLQTMLPILPLLLVGLIIAWCTAPSLNAMALGDTLATSLGVNIVRARVLCWLAAVVLCAGATSLAGPIGFVGLVVPHAARLLVGSNYRNVLIYSALLGALLLVGADVIGRMIMRPQDVAVGIITAVLGAPVFIGLVRMRTKVSV